MKKYLAELIGTFTLVLFGCGAAVLAGNFVGQLGIAFAFGLTIVGMAYAIGPVSGCHINPAVTIGAWFAKRIETKDAVFYIVAQFIGAAIASLVLYLIASGSPSYDLAAIGLGQNGFGANYNGGYTMTAAIIFETIATFIFVFVVLGATHKNANFKFAGLGIGLTLVFIHIVGIQITGVSVNPARSFGPALFNMQALSQLWLFLVFPTIGGILAGLAYRFRLIYND